MPSTRTLGNLPNVHEPSVRMGIYLISPLAERGVDSSVGQATYCLLDKTDVTM